ncbi:hypothetical protein [Treponema endosymbiont of Eucomonympha sp.]|uniref:hypothetical protein n=2 Tax=Treponema endosymbiont of Eucomonympha sp. TaxID=1580831 RepID=UPI000750A847|nr:hypothetical protein [Treponema endosymbiont of Eucomonympha sp.]
MGMPPPTLGYTYVFYDAEKDTTEGFTIYVPDGAAKTTLEAEINRTDSNWHKALYTDIGEGEGKFKEVAVVP